MTKKGLFIQTASPYSSRLAQESLESLLLAGSFNFNMSLWLTGNAIFQCLKKQTATEIFRKNLSQQLLSLPLFDIEHVYLDTLSLKNNNITPEDIMLEHELLDNTEIPAFIQQHSFIMSF